MPFNSETAIVAGQKGRKNRVKKDPTTVRNIKIIIKLSELEHRMFCDKAETLRISRNELIVRAVAAYDGRYTPK